MANAPWSGYSSASLPLSVTDLSCVSQNLGTTPTSNSITIQNLADDLAAKSNSIITGSDATLSSLDFDDVTKIGLILNGVTTTERDAIVSPNPGGSLYNITTNSFNGYLLTSGWVKLLSSVDIPGGGSLGTMSIQNATAIAVTGGVINGVPIGGTTPADGKFNGLTSEAGTSSVYYEQKKILGRNGTAASVSVSASTVHSYSFGINQFVDISDYLDYSVKGTVTAGVTNDGIALIPQIVINGSSTDLQTATALLPDTGTYVFNVYINAAVVNDSGTKIGVEYNASISVSGSALGAPVWQKQGRTEIAFTAGQTIGVQLRISPSANSSAKAIFSVVDGAC